MENPPVSDMLHLTSADRDPLRQRKRDSARVWLWQSGQH